VVAAPFEGNTLTTDAAMFALMKDQLARRPELRLGGPSITWLDAALRETFVLARRPSPDVPAYVAMGSRERVADPARIVERMARWPGARFDVIEGAEHEIVMETPERRARFFGNAAELFDAQAGRGA
jgi:lysophospholipase